MRELFQTVQNPRQPAPEKIHRLQTGSLNAATVSASVRTTGAVRGMKYVELIA